MKKSITLKFILFLLIFVLQKKLSVGQIKNQTDLTEAKAAIAKSNSIYFEAFVKGDSSVFINRYTDDCMIMSPDAPPYYGAKGALEFYKLAYSQYGLRNGKFITTQVYGNGDAYVTEEGMWQLFDANQKLIDEGKFLVLWKKTLKGWKMHRDSISSNRAKTGKDK